MMDSYLQLDSSDMEEKMTGIDHLIAIRDIVAADHLEEETERKTFPYVPLKQGYLQDGFYSEQVTNYPFLQLDLFYSAIANNYYDYAARQHEEIFNHPLKGTDHYMLRGTREVDVEGIYAYHISQVL